MGDHIQISKDQANSLLNVLTEIVFDRNLTEQEEEIKNKLTAFVKGWRL